MRDFKKFVPLQQSTQKEVAYTIRHYRDIESLTKQGLPLLVTATTIETKFLHEQMQPLHPGEGIIEVKKNNATYYFGKFGDFVVAHVECGAMGSVRSMGSIPTTMNAIDDLKPKFVLMAGIAFGVAPEKQNIGDVLVSNTVIPYEVQRVGKESVWRGAQPEANNNLRNTFKNARGWKYKLPNGENARHELCDILSGEKLVDDLDYRDALTKQFPTAHGGEMEGAGVYAACQDKGVPWILVKAVCDYADGHKKKQKTEKQELAITVCINLCLHIFEKKHVFEHLGVKSFEEVLKNVKLQGWTAPVVGDDPKSSVSETDRKQDEREDGKMPASTVPTQVNQHQQVVLLHHSDDEVHRKTFRVHLKPLERDGIHIWDSTNVKPGEVEDEVKTEKLRTADFVLYLDTPNFEGDNALVAAVRSLEKNPQVVLIPVNVNNYNAKYRIRGLPSNDVPVLKWPTPDEAWADVVKRLAERIR